jgi:hypothetical protein
VSAVLPRRMLAHRRTSSLMCSPSRSSRNEQGPSLQPGSRLCRL